MESEPNIVRRRGRDAARLGRMSGFPVGLDILGACVLAGFFWGGPADAGLFNRSKANDGLTETAAPRPEGIAYRTQFEGLSGTHLEPLLKSVSNLVLRADQKPLSRAALERRADDDLSRLKAALDSEGYYGASVRASIDFAREPAAVRVAVDLSDLFRIERFSIQYTDEGDAGVAASSLPRDGESLKIASNAPARAADVLAAQERLLRRLQTEGYPLAQIVDHRYIVDMATNMMSIDIVVELGGVYTFGLVRVEGATAVETGFIERRKTWKDGDVFDRAELERYRKALEETNLFRRVRVQPADRTSSVDGRLPIIVTVDERPHRTVGVGLKYATDEGFGGKIFWQNRNLFGRARLLDLSATVAETRQALEGTYRQPEFGRSDQALIISADLSNEATDAYNKRGFTTAAIVERKIWRRLTVSGGAELELSEIEDATGQKSVQLVSFPLAATWDSSNSLLDPTRGMRARLEVSPSTGNADGPVTFVTLQGTISGYIPVLKSPQTVLALRGRIGSVVGVSTETLPADRRFFVGGGQSIRGYAYRNAGPLDVNGDPRGGRSVIEAAAELRIKVTDTIGLVPFIDAGNVYDGVLPSKPSSLFVGAGLGLRYYSPIGPVRLDVGVPLDRRRDVDAPVQVYVSLGQAF